jgi:menaquinone-dependent protoporphyrinogen oxidase
LDGHIACSDPLEQEDAMIDVPVFYATSEGQTRRIAEFMATALRDQGLDSQAIEVASPEANDVDLEAARAVILAASVHAGEHQPSARTFARRHAAALNRRPSLFVSVSLNIQSTRDGEIAAARRIAHAFPAGAGWTPTTVACVAGRLAYTQYGFLKRWIMRRISAKNGGPTDTSRDYDYTDWPAVRALAENLARAVSPVRLKAVAAG